MSASRDTGPFDLGALSRFRFAGKREQAVREQWLAPLLVHLGYGGETLHDIRYEEQLQLRDPTRRLGSSQVRVDYVPTVLGHDLWIMEAKAPTTGRTWDAAISQAWLYATHPEIDVPFMAIADGARIAVYDVRRTGWDDPLVDIGVRDLATKFGELAGVLGAANVTRAVRERQLRHLGTAMRAEVSTRRLDEIVEAVKQLARDARSAVADNQRRILSDQFSRDEQGLEDAIAEHGLPLLSRIVNDPFGARRSYSDRALEMIRTRPVGQRRLALDELHAGGWVRQGATKTYRPLWNLRFVIFDVCLNLLDDEELGERARDVVRQGLRDHLLDFPDDPTARAGHALERILPAVTYRMQFVVSPDLDDLVRAARVHRSDEQLLRSKLSADRLRIAGALEGAVSLWRKLTWERDVLERTHEEAMRLFQALPAPPSSAEGPAGDPDFTWHMRVDPLVAATLYHCGARIPVQLIDEQLCVRLTELADSNADQSRIAGPARALLERLGGSAGSA